MYGDNSRVSKHGRFCLVRLNNSRIYKLTQSLLCAADDGFPGYVLRIQMRVFCERTLFTLRCIPLGKGFQPKLVYVVPYNDPDRFRLRRFGNWNTT